MFSVLANAAQRKPNVIVVFTDDHGYADLGIQGVLDDLKTPHLDTLASGGASKTLTSYASILNEDDMSSHTCFIENSGNTFSGTWISDLATLYFTNAGAVGTGSVQVNQDSKLIIDGNWNQSSSGAGLVVANAASAEVVLGSNQWTVNYLNLGGSPVAGGTYTASQLNALSAAVFTGAGSIVVNSDTDTDNLPDAWERTYFGNLNRDGSGDFDLDGLNDDGEYTAATDPTDASDRLTSEFVYTPGVSFRVNLSAKAGRAYQLMRSLTLDGESWTQVDIVGPLGADGPVTLEDSSSLDSAFYRIKVSML